MIARMQTASLAGLFAHVVLTGFLFAELPKEPIEIGFEPQFLFDNHIVDNHLATKYKRQDVSRVFHPAEKHPDNPILPGDNPSHLWVVRDSDSGLFRLYYQANYRVDTRQTADENQETLPSPKTKTKGRALSTK